MSQTFSRVRPFFLVGGRDLLVSLSHLVFRFGDETLPP